MNNISIYQLWVTGELDRDIKLKIIKTKIIEYCKIYHEYNKERSIGHNYTTAVRITAERMHTTEITVKRAVAAVI